jgi:hypothetical protein
MIPGGRPLQQAQGRKAGSKVPPAKRKAKNRLKEEEVSSITRYDADQIAAGDQIARHDRHQGGQDQAFLPRLRSINKRRRRSHRL